ncbi:36377_t:CDS:2, partial [Racocetra persica]
DLQTTTCKCKLSLVSTKNNRTDLVKQAYTHVYEPTWAAPIFKYIHERVMEYNYQINLKKSFWFSLSGQCHNVLMKLNPKKAKKKTNTYTTTKNRIDNNKKTKSPSPATSAAASEDRINKSEMSSEDNESEFALSPQVQLQLQLSPQPQLQLSPQVQSYLILPSFPLQQIPLALPPQPPLYNWAFGSQTFQSHQPLLSISYNLYQTLPYNSVQL